MPYLVKAYPIARVREFTDWPGDELSDDAVVFVHPDGSVRLDSLPGSDTVIWAGESAAFRACCQDAPDR
jgi:hypothetical protein